MGSERATLGELSAVLQEARVGGIGATAGPGRFEGYLFSRDALMVAGDLLSRQPRTARETLVLLPQWQAQEHDPVTEAQPGRLPHQVFEVVVDGHCLSHERIADAEQLAQEWGMPFTDGFAVYNTTDAPALYLDVLCRYIRRWGPRILEDSYLHRPSGGLRTVADAAIGCADWLVACAEASDLGLVETAGTNARQTSWSGVLRDGGDSYYHPTGARGASVNRGAPIAYLEVQARAYDGLRAAARVLPDHPRSGAWRALADRLPELVLRHFWLPEAGHFASAVDRDATGRARPVRLRTSAAFDLLSTGLLDGLPDAPDLVRAIVGDLYSARFMTSVGPTMVDRTTTYEGDYLAYQGARTSWGVVTGMAVEGLRRWGLGQLAVDLGVDRLLGAVARSGPREHWFLDPRDGRPLYVPRRLERACGDGLRLLPSAAAGESRQTWTASAAVRILRERDAGAYVQPARGTWRAELTRRAFDEVVDIPPAASGAPASTAVLDLEAGHVLAKAWRQEREAATVEPSGG